MFVHNWLVKIDVLKFKMSSLKREKIEEFACRFLRNRTFRCLCNNKRDDLENGSNKNSADATNL